MNTKSILGYLISAVGVVAVLLSFPQMQKALKLTLPAFLTTNVLTIGGIIILAIGVLLVIKNKSGSKQLHEVPIYHGDKIVGYRRMHDK